MTRVAVLLIALLAVACGSPTVTQAPQPTMTLAPTTEATAPATTAPATTGIPTNAPTAAPPPTPEPTYKLPPTETFMLTSTAFADNEAIPVRYTCDGSDDQLPVEWSGVPEGTAELALIQHDPDAGGFVHWVVVGIAPEAGGLTDPLPDGARHGTNGFGNARYDGPCPPSGHHTYVTTLFALSEPLDLGDAPTARAVRQAAADITIAQAQLRGTYRRT